MKLDLGRERLFYRGDHPFERWYATRAGSHKVEVPGASHSVYILHPKEVAALIEDAAVVWYKMIPEDIRYRPLNVSRIEVAQISMSTSNPEVIGSRPPARSRFHASSRAIKRDNRRSADMNVLLRFLMCAGISSLFPVQPLSAQTGIGQRLVAHSSPVLD